MFGHTFEGGGWVPSEAYSRKLPGFHLEETTQFIIKVLLNRVIFNKQSQLFEKYGSIYFRYFVRYLSIKILVYLFTWPPLGSKNQPKGGQVNRYTSI